MTTNIEIFVCWTDETTKNAHVVCWLHLGDERDLPKAQEYVANIGGMVLHYPFTEAVSLAKVRQDYAQACNAALYMPDKSW